MTTNRTTVQPEQQLTFFDNAIAQGGLTQNVFTVDLKKGQPGSYDFGFIDDSKHTGEINYVSIDNSRGFWEFIGTGYAVGDGQFQAASIDAIADTGTTLILIDDEIVSAYYDAVESAQYDQSQGGYTFDCDAALPDFTLGIGEYNAVVPGAYMNFAPLQAGSSSKYNHLFFGVFKTDKFPQLVSEVSKVIKVLVYLSTEMSS